MRILLVEDEVEMAALLKSALENHGMLLDAVPSLAIAREALHQPHYDLVLLDRQLPDGDGIEVVEMMRTRQLELPVVVLTARGSLQDRVEGLNGGADDYLVKPFAIEELLARIRAVARRPPKRALPVATVGNLEFDFLAHEARVAGQVLKLPRRRLLVLEALCARQGRTVRREMLLESVYNLSVDIQSNALDSHISKLRRALLDAGALIEIHVIRGVGYLLKEKV
jgi:DNA-binding response OmpR family regulator